MLTTPSSTVGFTVSVPGDATLYGTATGSTLPYVGFIEYPTSSSISNPDVMFGTAILSNMALAGQPPQCADPAPSTRC